MHTNTAYIIALAINTVASLGCSDTSKRALGNRVDDALQGLPMLCQKMKFDIPVNRQAPPGAPPQETLVSENSHIIPALVQGGYVTLKPMKSEGNANMFMFRYGYVRVDLTPKGIAAHVWDEDSGFCVGRPRLVEVLRWTEPADRDGIMQTRITFTWRIGDRPKWAEPELFGDLMGMAKPVEYTVTANKMSDGWQMADIGLMADVHVLN